MTTRRTDQKKKQSQRKPAGHGTIEHEEANLGQKEARLDKEKESELSNMGDRSRRDQPPS